MAALITTDWMTTNLSKSYDAYKDSINLFLKDFSSTIPVLSLFTFGKEKDVIEKVAKWAESGRLKILTSMERVRDENGSENGVVFFKLVDSESNKVITELHTSKNQNNAPLYEIVNGGIVRYSIGEWDSGLRIDLYLNGDKLSFAFAGENSSPCNPAFQYVKKLLTNFPIYQSSLENFDSNIFERIKGLYEEGKIIVSIYEQNGDTYIGLHDTKGSGDTSKFEEFYRVPLEKGEVSDTVMWLYKNNSLYLDMGYKSGKVFFALFVNFDRFNIMEAGAGNLDYFA
ncbi:MAG: hypothetical protein ACP5MX_03860 [Candidatus Micrarchaeia archaeon]